jgi:hypothetical protein
VGVAFTLIVAHGWYTETGDTDLYELEREHDVEVFCMNSVAGGSTYLVCKSDDIITQSDVRHEIVPVTEVEIARSQPYSGWLPQDHSWTWGLYYGVMVH